TMTKVWEDYQAWKEERENPASGNVEPKAYQEVVAEWKKRKLGAGKSERYVYHAGQDLMRFGAGQENRPIHEIPSGQLEDWIAKQKIQKNGKDFGKPWGLSTKRTWMSLFSSLWECAIAKGWAKTNIVDRLEPIGNLKRVKRIYPNETTLNLMAATMHNSKTQTNLAPMVLGFFGCMRPEEITSEKARRKQFPK